jgi:hypothetical protein
LPSFQAKGRVPWPAWSESAFPLLTERETFLNAGRLLLGPLPCRKGDFCAMGGNRKRRSAIPLKGCVGYVRVPEDLSQEDPHPVKRTADKRDRSDLLAPCQDWAQVTLGRERTPRLARSRSSPETSKPDIQSRQWCRGLVLARRRVHRSSTHGATTRIRKERIFTLGTLPHKTHSYPR